MRALSHSGQIRKNTALYPPFLVDFKTQIHCPAICPRNMDTPNLTYEELLNWGYVPEKSVTSEPNWSNQLTQPQPLTPELPQGWPEGLYNPGIVIPSLTDSSAGLDILLPSGSVTPTATATTENTSDSESDAITCFKLGYHIDGQGTINVLNVSHLYFFSQSILTLSRIFKVLGLRYYLFLFLSIWVA